jgi:predicted nucleic acid-binding protein
VRQTLRAADALQLASCLELRERLDLPVVFVAWDKRLLDAARAEGLDTRPA